MQLYSAEMSAYTLFGKFWFIIKSSIVEKLSNFIKLKYQTLNKKLQNLSEKHRVNNKQKLHEKEVFQFHDPIKKPHKSTILK